MEKQDAPLTTVTQAFDILDFIEEEGVVGPSAVAKEFDVSRSTAHEYLASLKVTGFVVGKKGSYEIGYRFLKRGSLKKYRNKFYHSSKVVLQKLASETGELAHIGVEEDGEWVLLHDEGSITSVELGTYPGFRVPLHTQAAGKALLAAMPEPQVEEILDGNLKKMTEKTITDVDQIYSELNQISTDGYAVDWNEQVLGVGFVGCAVNCDDELLGSLCVSCPTGRLKEENYRQSLVQQVQAAADEIALNCRYDN
ncbi:IclR family transcriptional regulator [Halobellus clavatus]|uniref:Transcriptional regulator, IclR family n=1 Tax=Halobellus clavatus TaxID=660517 RepID=A0A1H3IVT9_9EURY|nr:IclR family transcriptional regulator [Halobellus clavatus]SDY31379.1 transcriptional regulator, IclR family [Halobellus clavatus]